MPPWTVSKAPIGQPFSFDLVNTTGACSISGTTANTKSGYGTLIASTPAIDGLYVFMVPETTAANTQSYLIDLAYGSAGNEIDFIRNIPMSAKRSTAQAIFFPIAIPDGVRISARCQTLLAASNPRGIYLSAYALPRSYTNSNQTRYTRVTTYGANESDSGGTQIDPGATANTPGAWAEVTANTPYPIHQLLVYSNLINNPTASVFNFMIDIAVGANGSEIPILSGLHLIEDTGMDGLFPSVIGPIPIMIPANSRISVRARCSGTDATDRLFDIILMGID